MITNCENFPTTVEQGWHHAYVCKIESNKHWSKDFVFQFHIWLHMKHCITENMAMPEVLKKKSHKKAAPLRTLVGLIFTRNKICNKYSIHQGTDGFLSFQAINIA